MPRTRGEPSRRGTRIRRTRASINYSSSDEMDCDMDLNFQLGLHLSLASTKTPKQKKTPKRTKTRINKQASSTSRKGPNIQKRTKKINTSITDLDDSDDENVIFVESKSNNIKESVEGKVDSFFKYSGLISDDEDEVVAVETKTNDTKNTVSNKVLPTSRSVSAESNESILVIEDNANGMNSLADIENYCRETEDLLKNANALLEKFAGTSKNEEPQNMQPEVGHREEERQEKRLGECPICYESLSDKQVMSTKCGHLFCKDCIGKIVTNLKKCPTCRKAVNKKNIIPIYI